MMRNIAPKMAILAILAVVSWFCTSKIIAENRPPKTKAQQGQALPASTKGDSSGDSTTKMDGSIPVDRTGEIPAEVLADFRLVDMQANVVAGKVFVHAQVSIEENRPGRSYVWGLRVDGPSKDAPSDLNLYTHQKFSVNLGEAFAPTFDETITLALGAYKVKVVLYDFQTGTDVSKSSPGEVMLGVGRDIIIQ